MKISQFTKKHQSTQNVMDSIGKYSKMSEEDLFSTLIEEANKAKKNGTFDKQALENFYNSAYPMLTPEQRAKMRLLIDEIS